MNVNIIDFQVLQAELKDLKQKLEILECHINELARENEDAIASCPICGSPARTIGMMTSNDQYYYRTMCSNRRCELEDIPTAHIYPTREGAVEFWNNYVMSIR